MARPKKESTTTKAATTKRKPATTRRSTKAERSVLRRMAFDFKKIAASVEDRKLVDLMVDKMLAFGKYTVEDRALPDYRDGLKPVQRRILYAMYVMGLWSSSGMTKAANVSGRTMGVYHPHGDSSIYGAMVNMANAIDDKNVVIERKVPVHLIAGKGNWASWNTPPAAPRYTECRLSNYADNIMLNRAYMDPQVTPMVPNYLNSEGEPVVIPSLLPTLLLNGAYGMAVGVITNVPPFAPKGVIKLVKKALTGKEVTAKDCIKYLEIAYAYGAEVVHEKSDFKSFYETGKGSVLFQCPVVKDVKARKISIIGLTPDFKWVDDSKPNKEVGKAYKIQADDAVKRVTEESDKKNGLLLGIYLKDNIPKDEIEKHMDRIVEKYLRQRETFVINVTVRDLSLNEEEVDVTKHFRSMTVPEVINEWTKWRIDLELRCRELERERLERKIHVIEVLRKAIAKLDIVFKILKSKGDDLDKRLAKALGITEDDATIILEKKVRQLSKLEDDKMAEEIKELKAHLKQVKLWIKKPADKITADIDKLNPEKW